MKQLSFRIKENGKLTQRQKFALSRDRAVPGYGWPTTGERVGLISVPNAWMESKKFAPEIVAYLGTIQYIDGGKGLFGWTGYPETPWTRDLFGLPTSLEWYRQKSNVPN